VVASLPNLEAERNLVTQGYRWVIGCDEVGRGPIAGPVVAAVVAWEAAMTTWPEGLADSKSLTPTKRPAVARELVAWAPGHAIGRASAAEIEREGIMAALGSAVVRGLRALHEKGIALDQSVLLLDGTVDFVSRHLPAPLPVVTRAKADRDCVSVAAASVIAKVHRDELMVELSKVYPDYGFDSHKGYGAASHYEAIRRHGLTPEHRASWIRR